MSSFQRALLFFFLIGITIVGFGIWKTTALKDPHSGTCKILEEKYCKLGKIINSNTNNNTYTLVGFNFPAGARVPIFAAVDGKLLLGKEGGQPFSGSSANVRTANGENYDIRGNLDLSKFGNLTDTTTKAGEIIGYAQTTEAKSLGYDIVFTITKAGTSGPEVVEDKLRKLNLIRQ